MAHWPLPHLGGRSLLFEHLQTHRLEVWQSVLARPGGHATSRLCCAYTKLHGMRAAEEETIHCAVVQSHYCDESLDIASSLDAGPVWYRGCATSRVARTAICSSADGGASRFGPVRCIIRLIVAWDQHCRTAVSTSVRKKRKILTSEENAGGYRPNHDTPNPISLCSWTEVYLRRRFLFRFF